MTHVLARLAALAALFALPAACSTKAAPKGASPTPPAAPTGGIAAPSGAGGASSAATAGATSEGLMDEVPCTPQLQPGDEFYVPCLDEEAPTTTPEPGPDAAVPPPPPPDPPPSDAGAATDAATTLPPAVIDEGPCAMRGADCSFGHATTTMGSATCTIAGDFLSIEHEVCEVCSMPTDLVDFMVQVMDCGGCRQIYGEGAATLGEPLAANGCTRHSQTATLTFTLADPDCIDVYAYVGSGEADFTGSFTRSGDTVRVCRCDRATDVCTTCVAGACD